MDTGYYWIDCSYNGVGTMEKKEMTIYELRLVRKYSKWEFEETIVYAHKLEWFQNDEGQKFVICHYHENKQHTFLLDQFDICQYKELTI